MIKIETIGGLDVAKSNPVLTSESDTKNYAFITHEGNLYLISNTFSGDEACREDIVIPVGEYLNGYMVKAWEGQKLVIDEKHINYAANETYESITSGTTILTVGADGNLVIAKTAPTSGVYFKVTDKTTLTGKAVKALVIVIDADTSA